MDYQHRYKDIAERTKGDIYIGASVIIGLSR
ncbi:MAG: stage IV sporulation protein A [Defluviitaleaceae bacterium]|nr:stage IV sporulation protein A [Defluviitaleaceae bacterium]